MSTPSQPPSPDALPVLGHGVDFSRDAFGALREWAAEGDVVHLRFPTGDQYMVTDPDLVEQVLVEDQDAYTISDRQRETFEGIEDDAVNASTGDRWTRLRRALQPAFTWDGIRAYGETMAGRTAAHVDRWDDGADVDLLEEMRLLTVRILGDTLLGVDVEGDEAVVHDAVDAFVAWADFRRFGHVLPDWVPTPARRRFDRAVADLDDYVEAVLSDHTGDGTDVCSVLLAAHERGDLTWDEVRDNAVALLLAGHDSTAVSLTYAWYELSRHPDVHEAVTDEVDAVLGDGLPTVDDFDDLERTRDVVRETLRLYPPAWSAARQATEPVALGGYSLPAGAQLVLPQWVVHRDERFWDAPDRFDPDRWRGESDRPEYAYFPFGGGPRHCIGMRFARLELAMALATMVRRVDLDVSVAGDLTFAPSVSLRPEQDVDASVRRR